MRRPKEGKDYNLEAVWRRRYVHFLDNAAGLFCRAKPVMTA